MEKIKLYQLAFYIGTELKIKMFKKGFKSFNMKLDDYYIKKMNQNKHAIMKQGENCNAIYFDEFKLILKPLWTSNCQKSYFHEKGTIKEIFNNCIIDNHRDLFLEIFEEENEIEYIYEYLDNLLFDINKCPFSILLKLAELNYDIFDLIPKNLAISFYSC